MISKKILLYLLTSILYLGLQAHSGKAGYHVIIETDGGMGDLRAISLLLASKDVEVIGILCTDEITNALTTESSVRSLIEQYHHDGIAVGRSVNFLQQIYRAEKEKITYICLTSLRTVADDILNDPVMAQQTSQVLWFAHDANTESGYNHTLFTEKYEQVYRSGIKLIQVSGSADPIPSTGKFWRKTAKVGSRYASYMLENKEDFLIDEELLAIYLTCPSLFYEEESITFPGHIVFHHGTSREIRKAYLELLNEKEPDYKIFEKIPLDDNHYQEDIGPYISRICNQHGESEWRAGALCFELHGHIGIYAIIGVKMGLRAREYFNIGLDDLRIESHAGLAPPISCLNDGLQVSTGSSLGHGLISVSENDLPEISATFYFKENQIRISLRQEIAAQMKNDIINCIEEYGKLTPAYWEAVRALALEYWLKFDRNQIFSITNLHHD